MSLFRKNIDRMHGYTPGEQPRPDERVIKLNTNENPYPPSPKVPAALREMPADLLRRYPDPMARRLCEAAARTWTLPGPEWTMAGNGSDDLLTIVIRAFVGEGESAAWPTPTYSLYESLCEIQNAKAIEVPWPADFSLPPAAAFAGAKLVFLCNPNAPTGTFVPVAALEAFCDAFAGVVVIDEAYCDFAEDSFLRVLPKHPNAIVLRTFSKSYSLAGARIGIAAAAPEMIRGLVKVKDSYNLDAVAIRMGVAAMEDVEYFRATVEKIRAERARLTAKLTGLGFDVLPSQSNFVLARRTSPAAKALYQQLKAKGILVRFFDRPGLTDALRITVGLPEETDALIAELGAMMK
jgi:histidinol-phosphate aminotransferase